MNSIKRLFSTSVGGLILVLLAMIGNAIAGPIGFSVRSEGDDHLYRIDLLTGVATDLGLVGVGDAEGLAFVGSKLYAIGTGTTFNHQLWNITDPPGFLVGRTGIRGGVDAGLDYDARTGTLYAYEGNTAGGALYRIDPATGAATLVGQNDQFADGLAIDEAGQAFVIDNVTSTTNDVASLYRLDLGTGGSQKLEIWG